MLRIVSDLAILGARRPFDGRFRLQAFGLALASCFVRTLFADGALAESLPAVFISPAPLEHIDSEEMQFLEEDLLVGLILPPSTDSAIDRLADDAEAAFSRLTCPIVGSPEPFPVIPSEDFGALIALIEQISTVLDMTDSSADRGSHRRMIDLTLALAEHCQLHGEAMYRRYTRILVKSLGRSISLLDLPVRSDVRRQTLLDTVGRLVPRIAQFGAPQNLPTDNDSYQMVLASLTEAIRLLDSLPPAAIDVLSGASSDFQYLIKSRIVRTFSEMFGNPCRFFSLTSPPQYAQRWNGYMVIAKSLSSDFMRREVSLLMSAAIRPLERLITGAAEGTDLASLCRFPVAPPNPNVTQAFAPALDTETLASEYLNRFGETIENGAIDHPGTFIGDDLQLVLSMGYVATSVFGDNQRGQVIVRTKVMLDEALQLYPRIFSRVSSGTTSGSILRRWVIDELLGIYIRLVNVERIARNSSERVINPLQVDFVYYQSRYLELLVDLLVSLGNEGNLDLSDSLTPPLNESSLPDLIDALYKALLPEGAVAGESLTDSQSALLNMIELLDNSHDANPRHVEILRSFILSLSGESQLERVAAALGHKVENGELTFDREAFTRLAGLLNQGSAVKSRAAMYGLSAFGRNICSALSDDQATAVVASYFGLFVAPSADRDSWLPTKLMQRCELVQMNHLDAIEAGLMRFFSLIQGENADPNRSEAVREVVRPLLVTVPGRNGSEAERSREAVSRALLIRTLDRVAEPGNDFLERVALLDDLLFGGEMNGRYPEHDVWPKERWSFREVRRAESSGWPSSEEGFAVEVDNALSHTAYLLSLWYPPLPVGERDQENRRLSETFSDRLTQLNIDVDLVRAQFNSLEYQLRHWR